MVLEEAITLLTLPPHPRPGLPPCPSKRLQLSVHFCFTIRLGITGVSGWPLGKLCGLTGTLCASQVLAVLADGCLSRHKDSGADVAGASDALLGRLIDEFIASSGADSEHALSLGLVSRVLVGQLLFGRPLPGKARALFASPVLALHTGPVSAVEGAAAVAAAMYAHANGLLDTLEGWHGPWGSDPFVGLEREAVFCKESTGTFLLHSIAVHGFGDGNSSRWG